MNMTDETALSHGPLHALIAERKRLLKEMETASGHVSDPRHRLQKQLFSNTFRIHWVMWTNGYLPYAVRSV